MLEKASEPAKHRLPSFPSFVLSGAATGGLYPRASAAGPCLQEDRSPYPLQERCPGGDRPRQHPPARRCRRSGVQRSEEARQIAALAWRGSQVKGSRSASHERKPAGFVQRLTDLVSGAQGCATGCAVQLPACIPGFLLQRPSRFPALPRLLSPGRLAPADSGATRMGTSCGARSPLGPVVACNAHIRRAEEGYG